VGSLIALTCCMTSVDTPVCDQNVCLGMSILKKLTKCDFFEKFGKLFFESTKSNSDRTRRRAARFRSERTCDLVTLIDYWRRYRLKRGCAHAETPYGGKGMKSAGLKQPTLRFRFTPAPLGRLFLYTAHSNPNRPSRGFRETKAPLRLFPIMCFV
jgi:hypothetical protein